MSFKICAKWQEKETSNKREVNKPSITNFEHGTGGVSGISRIEVIRIRNTD